MIDQPTKEEIRILLARVRLALEEILSEGHYVESDEDGTIHLRKVRLTDDRRHHSSQG